MAFPWREPKMCTQSHTQSELGKSEHEQNEERPQQRSLTNMEKGDKKGPFQPLILKSGNKAERCRERAWV